MTLFLIGTGLNYAEDISVRGLNAIKTCEEIYLEGYTSLMQDKKDALEKLFRKEIKIVNRNFIEQDFSVENAKEKNIAILIIGDVFSATTHFIMFKEAKERGIDVEVIHNASVFTSVNITGLSLYKFGKTVSIPYSEGSYAPTDFYHDIAINKKNSMHTLCLLDIKAEQSRFMTVNEAISILLNLEEKFNEGVVSRDTLCVGVARLGSKDMKVKAGKISELASEDFGEPPHSLIIPSTLSHFEKDALTLWK